MSTSAIPAIPTTPAFSRLGSRQLAADLVAAYTPILEYLIRSNDDIPQRRYVP